MSEQLSPSERKPYKKVLAVLTLFALGACNGPSAQTKTIETPPPKAQANNFNIHGRGYEPPLELNCADGPLEQHAQFEGDNPKAYIIEIKNEHTVEQAFRLKIIGAKSDILVARWRGDVKEQAVTGPTAKEPAVILLEPNVAVQVRQTAADPFAAEIQAACV